MGEEDLKVLWIEGNKTITIYRVSMTKVLPLLFVLSLLFACGDDKKVLSMLDHAEAVIEEYPDSAYDLLLQCDSLMSQQSEPTRMRHLLLRATADNKLYYPMPSDTLFSEVVSYYDNHGTPNQQLKAHYLLGCIYRDMKEAPQALQCYYDAIDKADTLSSDCDYTTLFSVYGQMYELYDKLYMSKEGLEALKQYSHYALKANNIRHYIRGMELTVIPYYSMRDSDAVLRITEECYQLYKAYGMPQEAAGALPTAILMTLEQRQYEKARQMMDIYENESGFFLSDGTPRKGKEHYYNSKGLYCMGVHRIDSAEYYFRQLLHAGYEYDACRGLLSVYDAKQNPDSIVKYARLCEAGLELLLSETHMVSVMQLSSLYDYTRSQKIAMEKEQEAKQERNLKWGIIVLSIFILAFSYGKYLKYKRHKIKELRQLGTGYADAMAQLAQANAELSALKESYSNMKDSLLQTKQAEIDALTLKIQEYQSLYNDMKNQEKEAVLFESEIVKAFRSMAQPKLHTQKPTESDWEKLTILLKQCLPLFYQNVIATNPLSQQELHTCILTRLNFPPSSIAFLLDTSPQRITNIKQSINKKVFGEDNAANLYKNLKKC